MVATSDSPVPAWFIAGLSMAMLRPFNEEKVKRTEEVRVQVFHDALRSTVTLAAVCFQRSQSCACLQQLPVHAVHHQYLQQSVQERAAASELRAARQRLRPQADQRGFPARHCSVFVLILHQVSPHVNAPLARVARNRGVSEDSYTQVGDANCFCHVVLTRARRRSS